MAVIVPVDPKNPEPEVLAEAAAHLRLGRLVAMPTETFYGLAADALNAAVVEKVFSLKGRPRHLPLPVIVDSLAMLERLAELPPVALRLAEQFWPGALSLVLRAREGVPENLCGGTGKLAARVSSHPAAAGLATALGGPITATSANRSGRPGLLSAADVERELGSGLVLILDGGRSVGRTGSTILDVTVEPPRVLRPGMVPEELIRQYLYRLKAR